MGDFLEILGFLRLVNEKTTQNPKKRNICKIFPYLIKFNYNNLIFKLNNFILLRKKYDLKSAQSFRKSIT